MKIYLSRTTAGKYGGTLNGNLRHLDRLIQTELDKSNFKISFDELWLTLSYPPMYILSGVVGIEKTFKSYYNKFPCSRLDRRYKKIDITLKAPEFSEHFDKEGQIKYQHKFEIEQQFKNISETELGKILIDKLLEAGEIIHSKLKKGDIFDFQTFKIVLNDIKQKINAEFLTSLNIFQQEEVSNDTIKRALELREKRKSQSKEKDKRIRDLRVCYIGLPIKALYPYDYQYAEIFLNLLAREGLMCPTYHHLYILVATTVQEALKKSFAIEDWYVNGLSVIDFEEYKQLNEVEKDKFVFNAIITGLKDIATIDNLDFSKIDNVIKKIEETRLETELLYGNFEHKLHTLRITYLSRSIEDECPIFFNLTNKTTNESKRIQIGTADNSQIHLWLHKVTMTSNRVKIKSSDSIRGQVWLKGKPTTMEFNIDKLMT